MLLLYHHVYCDPELDRDDEEMRLVNKITESLREDVKNITFLLTNRKNKETGEVTIN